MPKLNQLPVVTISPSDTAACAPFNLTFSSSISNGNFKWNFGDGAISNLANPFHVYTINGKMNVQLIYEDTTTKCSDTAQQFRQ